MINYSNHGKKRKKEGHEDKQKISNKMVDLIADMSGIIFEVMSKYVY